MFEPDDVSVGGLPAGAALRAAERGHDALAAERLLPVVPVLEPLLGRGVRQGATVAVTGSTSLALTLVAGASAAGAWVAAVNLPDLGVVAAAEAGIALDRLALVPNPPPASWAAVVAALIDGMDVVVATPPARVRADQARRLVARTRERRAVLVLAAGASSAWPDPVDLRLSVEGSRWHGVGRGHGHLTARQVEVVAAGRGFGGGRRCRLLLPGPDGVAA